MSDLIDDYESVEFIKVEGYKLHWHYKHMHEYEIEITPVIGIYVDRYSGLCAALDMHGHIIMLDQYGGFDNCYALECPDGRFSTGGGVYGDRDTWLRDVKKQDENHIKAKAEFTKQSKAKAEAKIKAEAIRPTVLDRFGNLIEASFTDAKLLCDTLGVERFSDLDDGGVLKMDQMLKELGY